MKLVLLALALILMGWGLVHMVGVATAQADPTTGLCIMGVGGFIGWIAYYFMRR